MTNLRVEDGAIFEDDRRYAMLKLQSKTYIFRKK